MGKYADHDFQRSKVYKAEGALHRISTRFDSIEECWEYAVRLVRRKRFGDEFPRSQRRLMPVGYRGDTRKKWRDNDREWYDTYGRKQVYGRYRGLVVSKGPRSGGSYFNTRYERMQLAGQHMHESLVIHELCHGVTAYDFGKRTAWHGQEFCHTYLWLVKAAMGKDAHDVLLESFKEEQVVFRLGTSRYVNNFERGGKGISA